jgi:hypothetical protein
MLLAIAGAAQEVPAPKPHPSAAAHTEHATHGSPYFPEVEFAASGGFRAGTYIQPLWRGLNLEGHYFGVSHADLGIAGGSWTFRLGRHVELAPGMGVLFGSPALTSPALTLRVVVEKDWFVAAANFIQSLRESEFPAEGNGEAAEHSEESEHAGEAKVRYAHLSDGNHVSVRWWRLETGFSWEHIAARTEDEWKSGARVAFRLHPHVSLLLYVLAPKTEFRGGILVHAGE